MRFYKGTCQERRCTLIVGADDSQADVDGDNEASGDEIVSMTDTPLARISRLQIAEYELVDPATREFRLAFSNCPMSISDRFFRLRSSSH